MTDSSALGVTHAHHTAVYAQRRLPETSALVALFHVQSTPHAEPVTRRHKPHPTASCLRKISAYNGGFRITNDDLETSESSMGYGASRYAKKRLSFADQHGGQLVLEREFRARDAPIYCNKAITYSLPSLYEEGMRQTRWGLGASSMMERLLRRRDGRGSEEQESGWSQSELLSLCVLSCSLVGYVALSYARATHSK